LKYKAKSQLGSARKMTNPSAENR